MPVMRWSLRNRGNKGGTSLSVDNFLALILKTKIPNFSLHLRSLSKGIKTMKKRILLPVLFLCLAGPLHSQSKYDTIYSRPVGPGMIVTRVVERSVPWSIYVLTVDLKNPYIHLETAKANERLAGNEPVSAMAARHSAPDHTVVAGVNGDFYDTSNGVPINIQIENGEILRRPNIRLSTIGFTASSSPMLNIVSFSTSIIMQDTVADVQNVNATRSTDQLILYNSYMGVATATNQWGTEALIHPTGGWIVNDTMTCVVDSVVAGAGNMTIPAGRAVLSGHGKSQRFIDSRLHKGDTIRVYQGITPGLPKLKEMLGGYPKIVYNGVNYADQGVREEGGPSHAPERNPRTLAGFSADSSKLFLIAVDGRQERVSLGMTLREAADFMVGIGVYHGLNFDGGGSTTMLVRGTVMNSPSDGGGGRAVSNALLVVSSAPRDTVVATVSAAPRSARVFHGDSIQVSTYLADKYGNPLTVPPSRLQYSVDSRLGRVSQFGVFTAAMVYDSGYVRVACDGKADSVFVVIKSIGRIEISPRNAVTDTSRAVSFHPRLLDTDGVDQPITTTDVTWSTSDASIGTIGSDGVFRGRRQGSTTVLGTYGGHSDSVRLTVQLGSGFALLDSMDNASTWILSSLNVDSAALSFVPGAGTVGGGALRIDYRFTYEGSLNWVYLHRDVPVYGVPDSIWIDAKTDTVKHSMQFIGADESGSSYIFPAARLVTQAGIFDAIPAYASSQSATFNYPITFKRIAISVGGGMRRVIGQAYSGTLYLDNLRVSYPNHLTGVMDLDRVPQSFRILQNYPNPFNSTTVIRFTCEARQHVTLKLYDVLGRECATVFSGEAGAGEHKVTFNAESLTTGVYFLRAEPTLAKPLKVLLMK